MKMQMRRIDKVEKNGAMVMGRAFGSRRGWHGANEDGRILTFAYLRNNSETPREL